VPPDQVIDTVDLYFIKERQRRISLRFLTWFVLQQDIQQETHDSIEDARSALLLYKAYQDMEEEHTFDDKLEELYRVGRENVRRDVHGSLRANLELLELETAECHQRIPANDERLILQLLSYVLSSGLVHILRN
jgi:hypothetical protein